MVTADAAGRFAFDGVPQGIAQLLVHPPEGGTARPGRHARVHALTCARHRSATGPPGCTGRWRPATPAATLAALDGAALAHLAAHGQHQAENALFSTLELAGGALLGYDLQRAGRAPDMVVLSSCDVGLTDVRPGDETFGMSPPC